MSVLGQVCLYLAASVLAVLLFKRLGLGAILGYLVAGALLGPGTTGLVSDPSAAMHFGEAGVVLLLFVIGLELQPSRLWAMRGHVFGLGGLQVGVTSLLFTAAGLAFGLSPVGAVTVGFALSLSSTALALPVLAERKQLGQAHGRVAVGILLFQDVAAIPFLALLPTLAGKASEGSALGALKAVAVLGAMVPLSRFALRPLLRAVGAVRSQELFTASALLLVTATALLMEWVGLSAALGAFLAGVLLADSEYRHELEADIEPFKGLLMGLFFVGVGMSLELGLVLKHPLGVAGLVTALLTLKAAVLLAIGRWKLGSGTAALRLAVACAQGGEFAFVLLTLALGDGVVGPREARTLALVVGMSMAATPLTFAALEWWLARRAPRGPVRPFDVITHEDPPVLIAGFGRVGQVVGRLLNAKRVPFTALDASPEHVDFVRRFGNQVFYGDATRLEMLEAAGAGKARIFVLAIDELEASMKTVELVRKHFPHLAIVARARNRQHAYRLLEAGVSHLFRETLGSALELSGEVLHQLGYGGADVERSLRRFREHDEALLLRAFEEREDLEQLQRIARSASEELQRLFEEDAKSEAGQGERAA